MLQLLSKGGGDAMVAHDLDRAVRDPRDLEDLIDAKVLYGFDVHSTTGNLRLDTDSDIAMARVLVAMANKSSADTARRVARAARQQRSRGAGTAGAPRSGTGWPTRRCMWCRSGRRWSARPPGGYWPARACT
jgi:DNA invertase Pin-like site-specific DNA recombinase